MKIRIVISILALIGLISYSAGAADLTPTKTPVPSDSKQEMLIQKGIEYHDMGNYEAAINHYKQVLELNPDNVHAMYEISMSFYMLEDLDKSLEYMEQAVQYISNVLPDIYVLMGTIYDIKGKSEKSIEVYKKGIEYYPEFYLLHYNLGITYKTVENFEQARECFKQSMQLAPSHPGSHLGLATLYFVDHYNIPALLAGMRFLILEPESPRTNAGLYQIQYILGAGVERDEEKANTIKVSFNINAPKYDGDFTTIELFRSMSRAASMTERDSLNLSDYQVLVREVTKLSQMISEMSEESNEGFVWEYYVPYFTELNEKGYSEAMAHHIFKSANNEENIEWMHENQTLYKEFLNWSDEYEFPDKL